MNNSEEFEKFRDIDRFQIHMWDDRGLIPSPQEAIQGMNNEVNKFIDFIISIQGQSLDKEKLTEKIQDYIDEMDLFDFDTEETEWIFDELYPIIAKTGIDCSDLLI